MTRTQAVLLAVAALALVLLAGCATDPPLPAEQPATPARSSPSLPEAHQAPDAAVIPGYSIAVPKLRVSSSLVSLGLNPDRTVQVPALDAPQQLGLYQPPRGAPRPGGVGPAVILAHVNGRVDGRSVPGAFAELDTLVERDRIDAQVPDGLATRTVRFEVYRVQSVPKEQFPTAEVYSDTPGPELRLVTCGGEFDQANRNYLSNVIVYARVEQR